MIIDLSQMIPQIVRLECSSLSLANYSEEKKISLVLIISESKPIYGLSLAALLFTPIIRAQCVLLYIKTRGKNWHILN